MIDRPTVHLGTKSSVLLQSVNADDGQLQLSSTLLPMHAVCNMRQIQRKVCMSTGLWKGGLLRAGYVKHSSIRRPPHGACPAGRVFAWNPRHNTILILCAIVCGSLADGKERLPRTEKYCDCTEGWSGINCNGSSIDLSYICISMLTLPH